MTVFDGKTWGVGEERHVVYRCRCKKREWMRCAVTSRGRSSMRLWSKQMPNHVFLMSLTNGWRPFYQGLPSHAEAARLNFNYQDFSNVADTVPFHSIRTSRVTGLFRLSEMSQMSCVTQPLSESTGGRQCSIWQLRVHFGVGRAAGWPLTVLLEGVRNQNFGQSVTCHTLVQIEWNGTVAWILINATYYGLLPVLNLLFFFAFNQAPTIPPMSCYKGSQKMLWNPT